MLEKSATKHIMTFKSAGVLSKFSTKEIEQLFNNIKLKFRKVGLEILLAPRSLDYGRLLLPVSRRTGNAPRRNLFKRRVKAIFFELKLFNLEFDWIIIPKNKTALSHDFKLLQDAINKIVVEITSSDFN